MMHYLQDVIKNQTRLAYLQYEVEMFLAGTPVLPNVLPIEEKKPIEAHFKPRPKLDALYKAARVTAKKNGEKTFVGKPCRVCSHTTRFTSNTTCIKCSKRYCKIHQKKKVA